MLYIVIIVFSIQYRPHIIGVDMDDDFRYLYAAMSGCLIICEGYQISAIIKRFIYD